MNNSKTDKIKEEEGEKEEGKFACLGGANLHFCLIFNEQIN